MTIFVNTSDPRPLTVDPKFIPAIPAGNAFGEGGSPSKRPVPCLRVHLEGKSGTWGVPAQAPRDYVEDRGLGVKVIHI